MSLCIVMSRLRWILIVRILAGAGLDVCEFDGFMNEEDEASAELVVRAILADGGELWNMRGLGLSGELGFLDGNDFVVVCVRVVYDLG